MEWTILVMRRAPTICLPSSAPRISVYQRTPRLDLALETAVYARQCDASHGIRSQYWICRSGLPAATRKH